MKRVTAAVAAIGLVATGALVSVSGVASAEPENSAQLKVAPPPTGFDGQGAKKAVVTWGDYPTIEPGFPAFTQYRVVADRNMNFVTPGDPAYGPDGAARNVGTVTVASGVRELVIDDLSAGKNYYFAVYALDNSGNVVEPANTDPDTPIGYVLAPGFNLSIVTSRSTVVRGNAVELSGALTKANGGAMSGEITIFRDPYPNSVEKDTTIATVPTTAGGAWTFKAKPQVNTRYWARYIPANGIGGWTKFVPIDVRAAISLKVSPDTTIKAGRTLTFRGKVDALPAKVADLPICWQSTAGGSWGGGNCQATIKADGTYVIRLKPGKDADGKYRVYSGLGEYYADSKSKPVKITIR